jgi:ribosomal protein S7
MQKFKNNNFLNLYQRLLGLFIKKGKKSTIKYKIDQAFFKLCLRTKKPFFYLLNKFFSKLNVFVETRILKVRRSRFIVPFSINYSRRVHLILKWLSISIFKNKIRKNFTSKFCKEFFDTVFNNKSNSLKLRKENTLKALSNRSNIHYRW